MRSSLFVTSAMIGITVFAVAAHARASKDGEISDPPPEPIYEVDPGDRPGYILAPGYWKWDGARHIWQHGRWITAREGYDWTPDRWEQKGDVWKFAPGHWELKEGYVEVEEPAAPPAAMPGKPAKQQLAKKHMRVKKVDYSDPNRYPRVRRR